MGGWLGWRVGPQPCDRLTDLPNSFAGMPQSSASVPKFLPSLEQPASALASLHQVGVIGGGQLAWMMGGAAKRLGMELVVQTPLATDPAVAIASAAVLAPLDDLAATTQLARRCQVITFENEFVNLQALQQLAATGVCFRPSLQTLAPLLDKYNQRTFLQEIGLPVPAFARITPETDPVALGFSFPLVVKARRHGYDGQGTFIFRTPAELAEFWQQLKAQGSNANLDQNWLMEEFVPFERELAVMAARSLTGEVVIYPLVETYQRQQVCHWAIAPAAVGTQVQQAAAAIAHTLLEQLQAVGIFGIELFLTQSGKLLVNEIAPRTHNSGHFTLDACETSQFEQHLRAVCNWPLGSPALRTPGAVMVNLLGFETVESHYAAQRQQLAQIPGAYVHWYGKTKIYPGRKLGHVTVLLNTSEREPAVQVAAQIEQIWYGSQR